jgi:ADP-ribose pyrophosphatase
MNPQDKPEGEKLGWRLRETSHPFATPWLRLRQDKIDIDDQGEIEYTYRVSPGAVGIVPITKAGEMVMIRQYRYPVDAWCIEIPAGGMHDRQGEALEAVARDELREEAGATCEELRFISSFYTANSTTDEESHVFLALGVELHEPPNPEPVEHIELCVVPVAEGLRLAKSGGMKNGWCALAVLLCEEPLRELGYL